MILFLSIFILVCIFASIMHHLSNCAADRWDTMIAENEGSRLTHEQWAARIGITTPCTSGHWTFNENCLNCGWSSSPSRS